jgi:hypothetical protein
MRPVGYSGKGKTTIGAYTDEVVADYISARAKRLEKTVSWAGGRIIQFWLDHGAPPLSGADETMPPLSLQQFQGQTTAPASIGHEANEEQTESALKKFRKQLKAGGRSKPKPS